MGDRVRAARRTILASARDESRGPSFADVVMRAVNQAVGFDGYCLFAVDPVTGLRCAMYAEHGLVVPTERLVLNETVEHDFNRYAELIPTSEGVIVDDVSRVVHEVARAAAEGRRDALCRARTTDGRWLVISGSQTPVDPVAVTVVVQPADTGQVLPAFAAWSGLSHRESEVLGLAATGLAAKQIARRLGLSVLTVNDHLGSTYRKTGVSGRDELLALMS